MIWYSVYIEVDPGEATLRQCLASALGLDATRVAIVAGLNEKPPLGAFESVAETWPFRGDCRLLTHVFFTGDESIADRLDELAFAQAFADGLGCAVLLPAEDDPNPSHLIRFRPHLEPDRVSVDPSAEGEGVILVTPTPPERLPSGV